MEKQEIKDIGQKKMQKKDEHHLEVKEYVFRIIFGEEYEQKSMQLNMEIKSYTKVIFNDTCNTWKYILTSKNFEESMYLDIKNIFEGITHGLIQSKKYLTPYKWLKKNAKRDHLIYGKTILFAVPTVFCYMNDLGYIWKTRDDTMVITMPCLSNVDDYASRRNLNSHHNFCKNLANKIELLRNKE